MRRTKRKIKKFAVLSQDGKISLDKIRASVMSWLGHCKHADTWRIREKVLGDVVFMNR